MNNQFGLGLPFVVETECTVPIPHFIQGINRNQHAKKKVTCQCCSHKPHRHSSTESETLPLHPTQTWALLSWAWALLLPSSEGLFYGSLENTRSSSSGGHHCCKTLTVAGCIPTTWREDPSKRQGNPLAFTVPVKPGQEHSRMGQQSSRAQALPSSS